MLTADLVQTTRRGDRLYVRKLGKEVRQRAGFLAERYLEAAEQSQGLSKESFDERIASIGVRTQDRKLADGLLKLVHDRCVFEMAASDDPVVLRREIFELAARLRRDAKRHETSVRETALDQVASARDVSRDEIEALMYADLKSAHRLVRFESTDAGTLLQQYEKGLEQAVLLKAVRLRLVVRSEHPGGYRNLFHKLKFLRLLHVVTPLDDGCYQIDIDGPYALFRSVTKYGLQLALLLPALQELDSWRLDAEVVWGRDKRHLNYRLEDKSRSAGGKTAPKRLRLPDELRQFISRFEKRRTAWDVHPGAEILELKGVGLCVPDLVFLNRETGEQVFFERMGFWSREAVWKRVELVERGLPYRIIFAVSSRLRVSQDVLDEDLPGSLYVYKGVMDARRVAEILDGEVVISPS